MKNQEPVRISTDVSPKLVSDIDALAAATGMTRATWLRVKLMALVRTEIGRAERRKVPA